MESSLRIISYNCQSFNSNAHVIKTLLGKCEVLLLQETLIPNDGFAVLDTLSDEFAYASVPAKRKNDVFVGRSSGGLVIYWKKMNNIFCKPVYFSDRVMGLKLKYEQYTCLILNVYSICDYRTEDSLIEYKSVMSQLSNICSDEVYDDLVIMGDFNCDPTKGRFFKEFSDFAATHSLIMSDIHNLPLSSYTYISPNCTASTSWLDHVLASRDNLISEISIIYGYTMHDHIPLFCKLSLPNATVRVLSEPDQLSDRENIVWEEASRAQIKAYASHLDSLASKLWSPVLSCSDIMCTSVEHKSDIAQLYEFLIDSMKVASSVIPCKNRRKYKQIAGWNEYCKTLYRTSRQKYFKWHNSHRPRSGALFEEMKTSRTLFKNALKECKKNEITIKKNILLNKFSCRSKTIFWKEVRKVGGNPQPKSQCIDGRTNPKDIISVFDEKFMKVLNDSDCQTVDPGTSREHSYMRNRFCFSLKDVNTAITRINTGLGWDLIHSNHLKYSG